MVGMDQQNPHPQQPGGPGAPTDPYGYRPVPPAEHTRPLPQYGGPGQPYGPPQPGGQAPPPPPRRARGLSAAVLAGALVLGGLAGVGGAATYDALVDNDGGTTGSSGPFQATRNAAVKDGTVEKVASTVLPSVVKVNVTTSQGAGSGSGIVLSKDGKILTNNHVVTGAGDGGSLSVTFNDGTSKKATVVGTDPLVDIAVIQVQDPPDLKTAALGKSGDLEVGQTVVAVGAPFGLNATVTSGIVSALNRPVSVSSPQEQSPQDPFGGAPQQQGADLSTTYPAIQTDAAINPGNSGGPLVDMSGRVVGINSSIRTASSGASGPGGSIGLGFAIPIDEVLPIVNQISQGEQPTHARLAVTVSNASGQAASQGAVLRSVESGGPAAKAGLRPGDVITKVDGQVIDGSESLVATIRGHRPGESVEITFVRGGKTDTTSADLGSDANTSRS